MILFCVIPDEQKKHPDLCMSLDDTLLPRIAHGDMQAFESLYYQTYQAVYGYLLSILKNQHNAEDILQDTYIKIRASAHLYRAQGKPLAWIFTIARNLAYMQLRREKQLSAYSYEDLQNQLDFSSIEDKETKLLLEAAFSILTDEERQIIILHANTGMKHREIASLLSLPLSTVLSMYSRGMKKLRKHLEGGESPNE